MQARIGGAGGRDDARLTMADYAAVGSIANALSAHADQVFAALDPVGQGIAERLFRRLTHRATGKRDTRRPARLDDVAAVAGVVWWLVENSYRITGFDREEAKQQIATLGDENARLKRDLDAARAAHAEAPRRHALSSLSTRP